MLLKKRAKAYNHRKSIHQNSFTLKSFYKYFNSLNVAHIENCMRKYLNIVCRWSHLLFPCRMWIFNISHYSRTIKYIRWKNGHTLTNTLFFMQIFIWMFSCYDQINEHGMFTFKLLWNHKQKNCEHLLFLCIHKKIWTILSEKINWNMCPTY